MKYRASVFKTFILTVAKKGQKLKYKRLSTDGE